VAQSSNATLQTTRRRKPAGQPSGSSAIAKRAAARWFCWRMRPICRFSGAASRRFFQQIAPMLEKVDALPEQFGRPETLLADNGYFSEANVMACTAAIGKKQVGRTSAPPLEGPQPNSR
jgi:hypothetical protein